MSRVKGNTGALLLFIGTIIITVSVVLGIILNLLAIGPACDLAAAAVRDAGGSADEEALARTVALVTLVAVVIISTLINLLVIIPGFKYSLQGKCRTWAFVMAIIGIISVALSFFNIQGSNLVSVLIDAAGLILYIVGVFMLRSKEKAK